MRITARAKKWCKRIGRAGENAAADMLVYRGCEIVLRNCRTPAAELDIIARDGFTLVFTEVKTRFLKDPSKPGMFRPMDNLSRRQKQRILRGARYYLRVLSAPGLRYRFDVVEVFLSRTGPLSLRHHIGAFGYDAVYRGKSVPDGGFPRFP